MKDYLKIDQIFDVKTSHYVLNEKIDTNKFAKYAAKRLRILVDSISNRTITRLTENEKARKEYFSPFPPIDREIEKEEYMLEDYKLDLELLRVSKEELSLEEYKGIRDNFPFYYFCKISRDFLDEEDIAVTTGFQMFIISKLEGIRDRTLSAIAVSISSHMETHFPNEIPNLNSLSASSAKTEL